MVKNGLKWSMIVWNGPLLSEMVQDGPRWSKIPKWSKMLEALEKIHFANVQPERRRREGWQKKKGSVRPSSPFPWFNLFSVFFSFLFVQTFPYGQVARLFQMSHGVISPSLMVLFLWKLHTDEMSQVPGSCKQQSYNKDPIQREIDSWFRNNPPNQIMKQTGGKIH